MTALALAVLPNIPGFFATIKVLPQTSVAPIFISIYHYAWFVGFGLAFAIYLALRSLTDSHTKTDVIPPKRMSS